MNKIMMAGLVSSLAVMGGCSSINTQESDVPLMVEPDMKEVVDRPPLPDNIPTWYIDLPKDNDEIIHGSGSGVSSDLQFALDKAMHQAKIVLADKMSNTVSAELQTYVADDSSIGNGMTVEETQRISKSGFKNVDVSGYEVINKAIYKEADKFRTYVLLLLKRKLEEELAQSEKHIVTPVDMEKIEATRTNARQALSDL